MTVGRKIPKVTNKSELKIPIGVAVLQGSCYLDKNSTQINEDNTHNTDKQVDFDELLPHAGEFGLYQFLLFLSTMPFYAYGVFVYFTQLFITEVSSQHWCWIPELQNLTAIERRELAIPLDDNGRYGYSQCRSYTANWTEVLLTGDKSSLGPNTEPCQHGWEFNATEIPYPTVSSEFGWVCERDSYQATAQSIFFFGSVFGGFAIGWLADRFGRLPAAVISNLIGCIGGVISIFARDFTEFSLCRFFMGMSYDNCMMMTYLLVLEYIAPKYRTLISNTSFALFYSLAAVSLPWIALACGHWKTISLATSLPLLLALLAPFILPESPRWLLTKGRVDEAIKKLLTIGRINKKKIPPKLINQFRDTFSKTKKEKNGTILEILKRPLLRKMFLLICLEYMCCSIVFDALVRSLGQLQFDFFLSFSVVSATEFPSLLVVAFVMDWLGRRWLFTITMSVACVFSVLTAFIGGGVPSLLSAAIARFSVNMAYNAAIQWGAEIFPTSVRASALSVIHITGYVAVMISPYIVYLETYLSWLPLVISGSIAALGASLALSLPETARKDMPQTFDDAEELIRQQKFWDVPFLKRKENKDQNDISNIEKY